MNSNTLSAINRMSLSEINDLMANAAGADAEVLRAARRRLERLSALVAGSIDGIDNQGDRSLDRSMNSILAARAERFTEAQQQ